MEEEQKKKRYPTRGKRKLETEMDDLPIANMVEDQMKKKKKKKKGTSTLGKRKMEEIDDFSIADKKKWKMGVHTESESPSHHHQKLPHEVIIDNILTRLPIRNIAKECAFVCKSWYKSILHPRFAFLHYSLSLESACRNPNLIFDILNTPTHTFKHPRQCTLRLDIDDDNNDVVQYFHKLTDIVSIGKQEPVGHCNGFQCLRSFRVHGECLFHITNPSCRPEDFMAVMYPLPEDTFVFCCGFGFDSLVNQYKIVLVYSNSSAVIDVHDEFKCMVFTLGSSSWRESTTPNTLPVMSISTGIIQEEKKKKRMILSRMSFSRSAIYVGGALYWRVLTREEGFGGAAIVDEEDEEEDEHDQHDEETEMLLCFDIHHEQFQLISLPLECEFKRKTGTRTITAEQQQQLIDHRLLEFQGSPCIVRLQTGQQQQRNGNCCCKIHLYVLKDRVKSAWSIETFDVCSMIQDVSNPPPCVIQKATSSTTTTTTIITTATTVVAAAATTTNTTTTSTTTHAHQPITQVLCVSSRVILYWFDGVCVQLYDLRRKRLKMVKYTPADPTKDVELFNREVPGQLWPLEIDDFYTSNKLIYCRQDHIDYKLHIYVENSLPLKTFIPKGCTISREYGKWYSENKDIRDGLGLVYTVGKNGIQQFHCFCQRLSTEGSS